MLHGIELPELPPEHQQLLRQFEFLYHQVMEYRTFNQLNDSGIIQRVRAIKQSFGTDFYHPHVLSMVAVYNAFFSERFDKLFHEASAHIKNFALKIQESGSSNAELENESTVKQRVEREDIEMLKEEYGQADHFGQISSLERAVDEKKQEQSPTQAAKIENIASRVEQRSAAQSEAAISAEKVDDYSRHPQTMKDSEKAPQEQISRFHDPVPEAPPQV